MVSVNSAASRPAAGPGVPGYVTGHSRVEWRCRVEFSSQCCRGYCPGRILPLALKCAVFRLQVSMNGNRAEICRAEICGRTAGIPRVAGLPYRPLRLFPPSQRGGAGSVAGDSVFVRSPLVSWRQPGLAGASASLCAIESSFPFDYLRRRRSCPGFAAFHAGRNTGRTAMPQTLQDKRKDLTCL